MRLTESRIEKLTWSSDWKGRRKYFADHVIRGLFVAIESTNSKSYGLRYSIAGKDKRQIYGFVSAYRLEEIREIARIDKQLSNQNIDPFASRQKRAEIVTQRLSTIGGIAKSYFESVGFSELAISTQKKYKANYNFWIKDELQDKEITDLTRMDIITYLEGVFKSGKVGAYREVRKTLKNILDFALDREIVETPLFYRIPILAPSKARDRYIKPHELPEILTFLRSRKQSMAAYAWRWIFLTNYRAGEARALQFSWICNKANTVTIPAEFVKSRREHVLPMMPAMTALIEEIQTLHPHEGYVFSKTGDKMLHVSSVGDYLKDNDLKFTPHDLRKTFATNAEEELEMSEQDIEVLLNHVNLKNTSQKHYRLGPKLKMKQRALSHWHEYLSSLTSET
ncbi:tyrosine-type recombinase/integrase [Alkalimarinus alittae]|uniref:Tyrosine-type recombinase/integrase n=1 Tax=Alkalimarinus alittae TaxID=2961619 RepID=A0ABY6MX26_9ALTE|nr:tyrosine-type recombinase/integrase [Alkalimarinus alittae]UZE94377.1 tyrosine-type recombinase/integrase [Alkalimarinus alittae]